MTAHRTKQSTAMKAGVDNNQMQKQLEPFEVRMVEEKVELSKRVEKLGDFFCTQTFVELARVEQILLEEQYKHMSDYLYVLRQRLAMRGIE